MTPETGTEEILETDGIFVVYLNPSYLSRLYNQTTGHGLTEYISEKRMEKAKALLKQTSFKIHEIARQVGLEVGYFIKLFKKHLKNAEK
jgi:two-component system response regulator YesN